MPSSYQAPNQRPVEKTKTVSQSTHSNMATKTATVQDILDAKGHDVFAISPQDTLRDAVKVLQEKKIGAVLVTNANGAISGILSERDIVRKLAETPGQTLPKKVSEVMTTSVQTCGPRDALITVLRRMTDGKFRHMPVEGDTEVVGVISIGDLVSYRLTELEHEALQLKQLVVG